MKIDNHYFEKYKKAYAEFSLRQSDLLYQKENVVCHLIGVEEKFFKNSNYREAIATYDDSLDEIAPLFINEITRNVLSLVSIDQRRIYLSILQGYLDSEYIATEYKQSRNAIMAAFETHISLVKIQNHIRKLFSYIEGETNYSVGLEELRQTHNKTETVGSIVNETSSIISTSVLALAHYYLSVAKLADNINNANKIDIAKKYGKNAQDLYAKYLKVHDSNDRVNLSQSKRKDTEKLKRFEKVLEYLESYPVALPRAKNEYEIFKQKYQVEYL